MDGAENKPMIRIHLDQQVTIDAVSGHEEVEDATVITEITGFDVEDDLYVLRGALTFSGFLRMEDASDTGTELPDAFDDRDVFATDEEMPEAPVMPFHHSLPFVLQVPVAAQQTHQRESGVLNVNPKIGQWNVHVLGEQTVHLRAELVIQGLSGQDGYVFRCGSQEEGVVASKLDQLLDQEESRSFIPPAPQLEEEAFEPPFESAWQAEEGANFAGMRQAFEGVESAEAPEDDWLIESPVQELDEEQREEAETEVVFTPDPSIVFPMPAPDTDWARQLEAADHAFSGHVPHVTPLAGAREHTRAYDPQHDLIAEQGFATVENASQHVANEAGAKPDDAAEHDANDFVAQEGFVAERSANESDANEGFAPERYANESDANEGFAQEQYANEFLTRDGFAAERFANEVFAKEDFAAERIADEVVVKEDFAAERTANEVFAKEGFAAERSADEVVVKEGFAAERSAGAVFAKEDFAAERTADEVFAKEDFAAERSTGAVFAKEGFAAERSTDEVFAKEDFTAERFANDVFANDPVSQQDFTPDRFATEDFAPERFALETFEAERGAQEGFGQEQFTRHATDSEPHAEHAEQQEPFPFELERTENTAELTVADHETSALATIAPEIEAEYHFEDELPAEEAIPAAAPPMEIVEQPFAKSAGPKLSVSAKGVTMQTDEPIKLSALLGDSRAQAVEALAESAYVESGSLTESAQLIRESLTYAESATQAANDAHEFSEPAAPVSTSEQGHNSDSIWADLLFASRETKTTMKFRVVQEDESLPDLAEQYNTPLNDLLRANNLQQNHVDAGQILYIPQRRR
ncbi:MAG: LysM peptidoglycan-binding domain-containing protein [Tumebacillaceae bacterium]